MHAMQTQDMPEILKEPGKPQEKLVLLQCLTLL
jgi:hypothetical protein